MKILHTGDWHVGSYKGPTADGKNLRMEDTCRCIEELVAKAELEEPDVVVIAGDLFKTNAAWETSGMPETEYVYQYLTMLSMICPVIVVRGTPNHDGKERFQLLKTMCKHNPEIKILTEPAVVPIDNLDGEEADIAVIPGFDPGVFRARCPGLSKEEENSVFTQELGNIVLGLKAQCRPGIISVLVSHYTVPGCNMESGQVAFYSKSEPVLLQETLAAADFDLVCMGHIHRPQKVECAARNVYYCGAVNTITFNDEGQERGFYLHEIGVGEEYHTFFHLPYRRMKTIHLKEADIREINNGNILDVGKARWDGEVESRIVRVSYSCGDDDQRAFDHAVLEKELYAGGAFWVSGITREQADQTVSREVLSEQGDPLKNLRKYLEEKAYPEERITRLLERASPLIAKAVAADVSVQLHGALIPEYIKVENYRNYRKEEFDFSNVTFCTINGENGAGKSSLFMDAILDCLYEEPREGEKGGWIRNAEDARSGTIEFTFRVGEARYRVTRNRSKSGRAKLQLSEFASGEWANRSRDKLADTQKEVLQVIGMDRRTFQSCVLIMQDQYGIFMEADKSDRMEVLGDILGLDVYADMSRRAAAELKGVNVSLASAMERERLLEAQREALGDPGGGLEVCRKELEGRETERRSLLEEIAGLRGELTRREDYGRRAKALAEEIAEIRTKEELQRASTGILRDRLRECEECLSRESEAGQALERIQELERQAGPLAGSTDLAREKTKERQKEEQALDGKKQELQELRRKRTGLMDQAKGLDDSRIQVLEEKAQAGERIRQELYVQEERREAYVSLSRAASEKRADYEKAKASYDREVEQYQTKISMLREKEVLLQDSGCVDPKRASCRFLADAIRAKERIVEEENALHQLRRTKARVLDVMKEAAEGAEQAVSALCYEESEYRAAKEAAAEQEHVEKELASLKEKQMETAVLKERILNLEGKEADLEAEIGTKQELVSALIKEQERYESDSFLLDEITTKIRRLEAYREMAAEFPVLRERKKNLEAEIVGKEQELDGYIREEEAKENSLRELDEKRGNIEEIRQKIEIRKSQELLVGREISELQRTIGSLEEKQKTERELKGKLALIRDERAAWSEKAADLEVLKGAFSQDGIPHNIIRTVLPGLADTANHILGQMTGGRMALDFVTERTLKSDSGKERATLDIDIEEYGKGRLPYKSKSGGEKVKASLAAALALAEVKSSSVGVQSGMLFIDEPPFLDGEGMQAYVDALEAIQKRYGEIKIMAITHDPTMKARFPQSIEIVKTEAGSRVVCE